MNNILSDLPEQLSTDAEMREEACNVAGVPEHVQGVRFVGNFPVLNPIEDGFVPPEPKSELGKSVNDYMQRIHRLKELKNKQAREINGLKEVTEPYEAYDPYEFIKELHDLIDEL
jgi:hypothetical protein